MERIEVLRVPQGTLYGKDVIGGLLKDTLYAGLNGQYMQDDGCLRHYSPAIGYGGRI